MVRRLTKRERQIVEAARRAREQRRAERERQPTPSMPPPRRGAAREAVGRVTRKFFDPFSRPPPKEEVRQTPEDFARGVPDCDCPDVTIKIGDKKARRISPKTPKPTQPKKTRRRRRSLTDILTR